MATGRGLRAVSQKAELWDFNLYFLYFASSEHTRTGSENKMEF